jgi:hypothetical protein
MAHKPQSEPLEFLLPDDWRTALIMLIVVLLSPLEKYLGEVRL